MSIAVFGRSILRPRKGISEIRWYFRKFIADIIQVGLAVMSILGCPDADRAGFTSGDDLEQNCCIRFIDDSDGRRYAVFSVLG